MDYRHLTEEEKKAYIDIHLGAHQKVEDRRWITTGFPDRFKTFAAGLLGLPIERRSRPIGHPLLVFSFIAVILGIFVSAQSAGLGLVIQEWGFIPRYFYRNFFLTIVTSFFLHASWMHLIGNAYYFYVFGDDVEDEMSTMEFIRFLFAGHLAGLILHMVMTGFSVVPLVGASAGISALLGYYMIRFPKRQITFMVFFFYVWAHLPAIGVFIWKFGWEYMVASSGVSTGVAHWAHLGGALWGAYAALQKDPENGRVNTY